MELKCSKCKELKLPEAYWLNRTAKRGYAYVCIECESSDETRLERWRQNAKKRRVEKREELKAIRTSRRLSDGDAIRLYERQNRRARVFLYRMTQEPCDRTIGCEKIKGHGDYCRVAGKTTMSQERREELRKYANNYYHQVRKVKRR